MATYYEAGFDILGASKIIQQTNVFRTITNTGIKLVGGSGTSNPYLDVTAEQAQLIFLGVCCTNEDGKFSIERSETVQTGLIASSPADNAIIMGSCIKGIFTPVITKNNRFLS